MQTFIQKILTKVGDFLSGQKCVVGICVGLVSALVVGVGVFALSQEKDVDAIGTENTQGTEALYAEEVFMTEETEVTEVTEMEVIQTVSVTMAATSFEKDLKIKILDENSNLIAGQPFVITVAPEGSSEGTDYNDHDMDGIIYIKSIEAGKYTVQFQEMEGFIVTENPITATVKEQIVYEKVEIKNEIKDESQINVSVEDTANKNVEVEAEIKDTLPLLESTVSTTVVEKEKVDFSNFPNAKVSDESNFPKTATLYSYGKESSKNVGLALDLTEIDGLIKEISWSVDNENVVDITIAEDKKTALLAAKKEGTAKVIVVVSYAVVEEKTETKEYVCDVTVGDYTDDTTQIMDTEGRLLYLDSEAKTKATPKDFSAADKFYATPSYTGWQTIDDKLYYYKEDHTPATGKQVIGGVTYEFDEEGYLIEKAQTLGIDVSKWQGEIDWKAVAGAGVDFAIIRCGYRGSSTGALVEDPYFKQNIAGATANGIKVGVYFFTQAVSEAEAIEEASMAISLVKGYHLQLPIFVDTEGSGGRGDNISNANRTKYVKAFCETVKNAGYKPGVYAGRYWYMNKINASELEQYHIWVAQYNTECTYTGRYDIWQYTESGTLPGIKGKVDMDISYRVYY